MHLNYFTSFFKTYFFICIIAFLFDQVPLHALPMSGDENITTSASTLKEKTDTLNSSNTGDTTAPAETYKMGELVVHGTLFEEKLARVPGSISVLQHRELGTGDRMSLTNYLGKAPGVFVQQGAYNTNRVIIRGVGSRTPYSSNRIRAYLDEIPLTSGDGVSSLEDIDMSMIGRVEVIRGPSGALYGSGMGGTIRLFTVYPASGNHMLSARAEIASFGTDRMAINGFIRSNKTLASAGVNYSHSDGYRQNNKFDRASAIVNIHRFTEHSSIQLLLLFIHLDAQIPSSLNAATFDTNPKAAAPNWLAVRGYESYNKILSGLSCSTRLSDHWKNTVSLFSTYMDKYELSTFNILDDGSISAGIRNRLRYSGEKVRFIIGAEGVTEKYPWKTYTVQNREEDSLTADYKERSSYANISLLGEWNVIPQLKISAAVNCNLLQYTLKSNLDSSGTMTYSYNPVISPRIGFNYQLIPELTIYSSFGHGFSPPSFEEALLPDGQPNPNLKPENGWDLDMGIRTSSRDKKFFADLTFYKIWLYDLLVTKRESESIFYGINAGKTSLKGLEIAAKYRIIGLADAHTNYLDLDLSATVSENLFSNFIDDSIDYSGKQLPGIPFNELYVGLRSRLIKHFNINLNLTHSGSQYLDDANTGKADSWNVVNAEFTYTHKSVGAFSYSIFSGIQNIFNEKYAAMILVNAPSFNGTPRRYYYPGLARNFYLGVNFSIK